jgi:hypothetical protein
MLICHGWIMNRNNQSSSSYQIWFIILIIKNNLFLGTGINGKRGGKDTLTCRAILPLMQMSLGLMKMKQEMCQMDSCVWSAWRGEGDLHSFPVGILHAVISVLYQLKVRYPPNALSVGRQSEILSGFLNVEWQRITVLCNITLYEEYIYGIEGSSINFHVTE